MRTLLANYRALLGVHQAGGGSGIVAKDNARASGSVGLEDAAGVAYECTGTECMPLTTCTVAVDIDYRIIGTFTGSTIRVRSIQRLSFGL